MQIDTMLSRQFHEEEQTQFGQKISPLIEKDYHQSALIKTGLN